MEIDKSKIKHGIWYEDADGNFIPAGDNASAPENAVTAHVCFPLEIRTVHFKLKEYTNPDGTVLKTYTGEDRMFATSCHISGRNEPVIMAIVNSGDYTLSEALALYADCCERCANVLAYKYLNGTDGYPEHSEAWEKCGTVCDYCRGE